MAIDYARRMAIGNGARVNIVSTAACITINSSHRESNCGGHSTHAGVGMAETTRLILLFVIGTSI